MPTSRSTQASPTSPSATAPRATPGPSGRSTTGTESPGLPPVDDLEALQLAGGELERRLPAVRDADLDRPSACPGWSVFDLVNHVIGGGHRYLPPVRGAAAADLAPTRTQDHVPPDPLAHFRRWE